LRFVFKTKKLLALYETEQGASRYPAGVVDAFFEVVSEIESAKDERDLYALPSLHFEPLKGKRGKLGQRSMRLNDQYRLIVTLEQDDQGRFCCIIEISKHYR